MQKIKNYYEEINKELKSYENYEPYHVKSIEWICNRIDWAWKWRKITKEQMEELAGRVVEVLKNE